MNQPGTDIQRVEVTRTLRCPRCRQFFQTPRRWQLTCPNCDHKWEETSVQTRRERVAHVVGDAAGRVFFVIMALGAIAVPGALLIGLFALFVTLAGLAYGIIIAVCFSLIVLSLAAAYSLLYVRASRQTERTIDPWSARMGLPPRKRDPNTWRR
jgi:hypothetical protein